MKFFAQAIMSQPPNQPDKQQFQTPRYKALTQSGFLIGTLFLASCGGGGGGSPETPAPTPPSGGGGTTNPPVEAVTGVLVQISDRDELASRAKQGFESFLSNAYGDPTLRSGADDVVGGTTTDALDSAPESAMEGSDTGGETTDGGGSTESISFTGTYTLESEVDEYDVVKYNGSRLFIAPTRGMDCCFVFEDDVFIEDDGLTDSGGDEGAEGDATGGTEGASDSSDTTDPETPDEPEAKPQRGIRILVTDADVGTATDEAMIPIADDQSVEGLYLTESSLVALTSTAWWGRHGSNFSLPERWSGQSVGVDYYSLGDDYPVTNQFRIEGSLVNSRKLASGVILITRHTPDIEGFTYYPTTDEERANNENLLADLDADEVLPRIELNGEVITPMAPEDCYVVNPDNESAPEAYGHPTITSMIRLNAESGIVEDAVCLMEPVDGIYLTTDALYLTQTLYETGVEETLIHQFDMAGDASYAGSARLAGGLFLYGNRDYRINARSGYLRAITTSWQDDGEDRLDHTLYVLKPKSDTPELEVVAQLPNESRPEELGKPNEDLYGVRFIGDRAYLVTFERIDPLYVLDLSDPADPRIAGSLEIPGFSNFLHPVSDRILMGLGQTETDLAKIEFFDISDIERPASLGALALDDSLIYSYSPAEWDRRAFTYWRRGESEHRMAIPVEGYLADGSWQYLTRLYLFELNDPSDPSLFSLTSPGFLTLAEADSDLGLWGEKRAILHEDAVFWTIGQTVLSSLWDTPKNAIVSPPPP